MIFRYAFMKFLSYIYISSFVLLTGCVSSSQSNVRGDLVCYVYEHHYKFGIPEKTGKLIEIQRYLDTLLVRKQYVTKGKRKRDYIRYKYNDLGQLVMETLYSRGNILLRKTNIYYDEDGRRFLEQSYDRFGNLIFKKEMLYDLQNTDWHQMTEYDERGLLKQVKITKFDDYGRRLEGDILGRKKMLVAKFEIAEHDSLHNETLKIFYKEADKSKKRIEKKYDDKSRVVYEFYEGKYKKTIAYNNDNKISRVTFYDLKSETKTKLIRYVYVAD